MDNPWQKGKELGERHIKETAKCLDEVANDTGKIAEFLRGYQEGQREGVGKDG